VQPVLVLLPNRFSQVLSTMSQLPAMRGPLLDAGADVLIQVHETKMHAAQTRAVALKVVNVI
jgi:hypothetical protein